MPKKSPFDLYNEAYPQATGAPGVAYAPTQGDLFSTIAYEDKGFSNNPKLNPHAPPPPRPAANWNFNHEVWTAQSRALNMAAYTHHYLPKSLTNVGASSPMLNTAGKLIASQLGWSFENGVGPSGKESFRYMGKSAGFLGSQYIARYGFKEGFKKGGMHMLGGAAQLATTAYFMVDGFQQDGIAGAGKALAEMAITEAAIRKIGVPMWNSGIAPVWHGAKAGFSTGRAVGTGVFQAAHLMKYGVQVSVGAAETWGAVGGTAQTVARMGWAARGIQGAMGAAGAIGGVGIGAAIGMLNPWSLAIFGGLYAIGKGMDFYETNNRAIARQRMVNNLEMGSPVVDQFGTISTLRQRSLAAIQNSHVNGRMALGNEAALLHRSF